MDYTSAPATELVATHCAICGRPLLDARSVELGVGPICAEKYGLFIDVTEAARAEANKLVYQIAARQKEGWAVVLPMIAELRDLGFATLAEKLSKRFEPKPEIVIELASDAGRPYYRVASPFVKEATEAWRAIPGRFFRVVKNGEGKELPYNFVPTAHRAKLWDLLRKFYAGRAATGPRGIFAV